MGYKYLYYRGINEKRVHILIKKTDGTDQFRDSVVDGRMVFKWILKKQSARLWHTASWLWKPFSGTSCEQGHDTSVPILGEKFLEKLKDCGIS